MEIKVASTLFFLLILNGCLWQQQSRKPSYERRHWPYPLVKAALAAEGKRQVRARGRVFRRDCSGITEGLFYQAGADLSPLLATYSGNGVRRLHSYVGQYGTLYRAGTPKPGDLIFWDNTHDRNQNKLWDDLLTHVGIIVTVNAEETLSFIHYDYIEERIVRAYMSLRNPSDPDLNSTLRLGSTPVGHPEKKLASHLFRSFGRVNPEAAAFASRPTKGA